MEKAWLYQNAANVILWSLGDDDISAHTLLRGKDPVDRGREALTTGFFVVSLHRMTGGGTAGGY